MKCDKCKKIKAVIKYNGGNYCTWYCVKSKCLTPPNIGGEALYLKLGRDKENHDFDMAMNGIEIY
jgi:hypothetical protein